MKWGQSPLKRTAMLRGVDTFYRMGSPFAADVDAETEQGVRPATLAIDEGIGHLCSGSVANADKATSMPISIASIESNSTETGALELPRPLGV